MSNINLKLIEKDILLSLKKDGYLFNKGKIHKLVHDASIDAVNNYSLLKKPKLASVKSYSTLWIKESVMYQITVENTRPISLDNPPSNYKATAGFHLVFSQELQDKLRSRIFALPPNERAKEWKQINLDIHKINDFFKEMIKERNKFSKDKGFTSRLDMAMDWCGVSKEQYQSFEENIDRLITLCNEKLITFKNLPVWFYSEFNSPCFICQTKKTKLRSQSEVFEYFAKHYKQLGKIKDKIIINLGNKSKMVYKKEDDTFQITIDKNENSFHQTFDLIHELSHVIVYLQDFKNGVASHEEIYLREKKATEIELKILKTLSVESYNAVLYGETLLHILRTLFEIEIYKKPDQNLEKLYANVFNRCYKNSKQKNNQAYLLDKSIMFKPFNSLPYAVANSNLLLLKI